MKKFPLVPISILLLFLCTYAQYNDRHIVSSIFKDNNLTWNIDDRITIVDGRIITLNLNADIAENWVKVVSPDIGKLNELQVLTLNDNEINDLPKELYACSKLVTLEVRNNTLKSLPEGISKLTKLKELDIRNNEILALPSDIGMLQSIYKIQLWGNRLRTLPDQIGNLSTLKELYLMNNRLNLLPETIINLRLHYLDISFNYLTDTSPSIDRWLKKYNKVYKNEQFDNTMGKFFL